MTDYMDDVPDINEETTVTEMVEYVRHRIEEPLEIDDTIVWNFSSHKPDMDALEDAVENKLQRDRYQIPFQVTGAQYFITSILPQPVREAEILIYRENIEQYYGYQNFVRHIPDESRRKIQQELAEIVRSENYV